VVPQHYVVVPLLVVQRLLHLLLRLRVLCALYIGS
jgi:hypothetical protein